MKINLPISQHEFDYRDSAIIISKTDKKGVITEINPDFIDISGYSKEELLGKAHNLVRHPDMPPAAFNDLWQTVKKGKLWNGIVKNRCKNGDHYWVEANVTPIIEGGEIAGYVSVRTKPTRQQIESAAELYKKMLQSTWKGTSGLYTRLTQWSLKTRLIVWMSLLGVLPAASIAAGMKPAITALLDPIACFILIPLLLRSTIRPLADLRSTIMNVQGDGNLNRRSPIHADDEIGQTAKAFNALVLTLRGIVREVTDSTQSVLDAAQALSASAEHVQQNSLYQNEAASATASAMEEMTASIGSVSDSAAGVRNISNDSLAQSEQGSQRVNELVQEVGMVEQAVKGIADKVGDFVSSTTQITHMTKQVRDIADQTNLLALNAAIEAARAGEQGRGFAVVADEVRKLAEKSAASAREIDSVTKEITQQSHEVVQTIELGMQHITTSQECTHNLSKVFEQSAESVIHVNRGVDDIASATREQAAASSDISRHVEDIAQMSEGNSQAVGETAQSAKHLRDLAIGLKNAIQRFKV